MNRIALASAFSILAWASWAEPRQRQTGGFRIRIVGYATRKEDYRTVRSARAISDAEEGETPSKKARNWADSAVAKAPRF